MIINGHVGVTVPANIIAVGICANSHANDFKHAETSFLLTMVKHPTISHTIKQEETG